jgi:hypothetical protein
MSIVSPEYAVEGGYLIHRKGIWYCVPGTRWDQYSVPGISVIDRGVAVEVMGSGCSE